MLDGATPESIAVSLAAGSDVNKAAAGSNKTPLHFAAARGDLGCLTVLLDAKADVLRFDADNRCPLALACMNGQGEAAAQLMAATAAKHVAPLLKVPDENRWTCLHHAVSGGSLQAAAALLHAGAETSAQERTGRTPFHLAAAVGQERMVEALLAAEGGHPQPFPS